MSNNSGSSRSIKAQTVRASAFRPGIDETAAEKHGAPTAPPRVCLLNEQIRHAAREGNDTEQGAFLGEDPSLACLAGSFAPAFILRIATVQTRIENGSKLPAKRFVSPNTG